jgi:hypothetical protein
MKKVNNYLYERLINLSSGEKSKEFGMLIARAEYLSSIGVDSDTKLKKYILVKEASKEIRARLSDGDFKNILSLDIKNKNDAYYLITKAKLDSKDITKVAYPSPGLSPEEVDEEYNISKWLDLVYKIYTSIESDEMSKANALEYYSNSLDKEERRKFNKWFEYYSSGEHLKYSLEEEIKMKKKAVYQSDLGQGNNPYYAGSGSSYLDKNTGNNMPGDSFCRDTFDNASKSSTKNVEEKKLFITWKQQLYGALRRVDKLIRSDTYVDHENYKELAEALVSLSILAKNIKLARTLSDVTFKTASTFERAGSMEAAGILRKIAQEVPMEEVVPEPTMAPDAAPGPLPGAEAPEPAALAPELPDNPEASVEPVEADTEPAESDSGHDIPGPDDVEAAKLRDIVPIPGARPGEYEFLAGDISLEDAATKLDEVAGLLADRRIIRQLAEFDIMLDKLGVASMFPELAESQSKLIDSFSYALTRVTKMMGQLANAKAIVTSRAGVPGAQEPAAKEPEEAVEETVEEAPELEPETPPESMGG